MTTSCIQYWVDSERLGVWIRIPKRKLEVECLKRGRKGGLVGGNVGLSGQRDRVVKKLGQVNSTYGSV